jgi:cyclophilin family peptidyl-prolyl cis-trans isomerase
MKLSLQTLALVSSLLIATVPSFAQDAEALAKEKAKLPDAVREIAEKGDSSAIATKATAAAKKATTSTEKPTDPASWGKQEVHKLAVMDVKLNGATETIIFELLPGAPKTVSNFIANVEAGTYKGLAFHRAIDNYLVQTGDPLTADDSKRNDWGTGGNEKTIPGEFKLSHKVGSVAMARLGDAVNPDRKSSGYQFYFALGNLSNLNGNYSVFGQVVSGLEVLKEISRSPADSNDCPLSRIEVKGIRVIDQKGPLVVMRETSPGGQKRATKPLAAKSGFTRFLERVW